MKKKKNVNANLLMKRIARGLSGWATYLQARDASGVYCEHVFYLPIYEIAIANGWDAMPQAPLASEGKNPKTIDFAFSKSGRNMILAEVKYINAVAQSIAALWQDMEKIRDLKPSKLKHAKNSKKGPKKFLIIISRIGQLEKASKYRPNKISEIKDTCEAAAHKAVAHMLTKSERAKAIEAFGSPPKNPKHNWNVSIFDMKHWPKKKPDKKKRELHGKLSQGMK